MSHAPASLWPCAFGAAVFDFDGTLASSGAVWQDVDREFLARRGIAWTQEYAATLAALGFQDGAAYTIERYGLDETSEDICAEWTRMSRELYIERVRLRPGAERYIRALRASGVRCALATNNTPDVLRAMKPHLDVDALFDVQVYGDEVPRTKQFPDIYEEATRRLGVDAGSTVVFEDIVPALRSAKAAGCVTCAVQAHDEIQNWDEVRAAGDLHLRHWTDLPLGAER